MQRIILSPEREEKKWRRLKELATKRHVPVPEVLFRYNVIDLQSRKVVNRSYDGRSHSLTRNAYNLHMFAMVVWARSGTYGDGDTNWKTIAGSNSNANLTGGTNLETFYGYAGGAADLTQGIIIGTGVTAEALADYVIETVIAEGTGGGQMEYGANAVTTGWNAGSSYYWSIWQRLISNNSGGSITVNEAALYYREGYYDAIDMCVARDIISPGVVVANGESLSVEYEFRLTYP